jgi:hypothetical protein
MPTEGRRVCRGLRVEVTQDQTPASLTHITTDTYPQVAAAPGATRQENPIAGDRPRGRRPLPA